MVLKLRSGAAQEWWPFKPQPGGFDDGFDEGKRVERSGRWDAWCGAACLGLAPRAAASDLLMETGSESCRSMC